MVEDPSQNSFGVVLTASEGAGSDASHPIRTHVRVSVALLPIQLPVNVPKEIAGHGLLGALPLT